MSQGPQQPWPQGQMAAPMPAGPPPDARPPSTAMLTVTSVFSAIVGLAYIGLFVLMAISTVSEISTIKHLLRLKENGAANITNTKEDLMTSIEDNELGIVVFSVGAALTVPLVVAGLVALGGRGWARVLATVCVLPPAVVIVYTVIRDVAGGHPENVYALVFTIPALVLTLFWWLPATSRGMAAKRWRRTAAQQAQPAMAQPPMGQPFA